MPPRVVPLLPSLFCAGMGLACSQSADVPSGGFSASGGTSQGSGEPTGGTGGADSAGSGGDDGFELDPSSADEALCGDGWVEGNEACDDGNEQGGDGCSALCDAIEPGYVCRATDDGSSGQECIVFAKCGDGRVAFPEQCDDGNATGGDGCNERCKLEFGYRCDGEPSDCSETRCGDGVVEGAEMCEPSLTMGCTSQCQFAPDCSGEGPCTSACGDGIVLSEECDDGNALPGDGCDVECRIEPGYTCGLQVMECERSEATGECILRASAVYRDFDATHSDFEAECAGSTATVGLVEPLLVGKVPVATGTAMCTTGFADWYADSDQSTTLRTELVLYDDGEGNYLNRHDEMGERWLTRLGVYEGTDCTQPPHCPFDGDPFFFPVDGIEDARGDAVSIAHVATTSYGLGGVLYSEEELTGAGPLHNFSFTSEISHWFPYDATTNARLEFTGDDDVWVFINGRLALDLGGLHPAVSGEVSVSGQSERFVGGTEAEHGMVEGEVYEIKIFHAERMASGSSFKLTLSGFEAGRSSCAGECGNGTIEAGEECDDGDENEDSYNHCQTDCRLGSYCGDGLVSDEEECDDALDADCRGCRFVEVR